MPHFAAREMTRPLLYRAFGLTIASGLPLPELPEAAGEPDVEIVTGRVPSQLPGAVRRGVRFQVAPGELLLQVDGVARYLARGGAQIIVDRAADAPPESVRLFLLGSVFAALLHERGVLPLSASAIATQRGAAVFMGLSGTGKSALLREPGDAGRRPPDRDGHAAGRAARCTMPSPSCRTDVRCFRRRRRCGPSTSSATRWTCASRSPITWRRTISAH
jgi:hypothetical protein